MRISKAASGTAESLQRGSFAEIGRECSYLQKSSQSLNFSVFEILKSKFIRAGLANLWKSKFFEKKLG